LRNSIVVLPACGDPHPPTGDATHDSSTQFLPIDPRLPRRSTDEATLCPPARQALTKINPPGGGARTMQMTVT
jgi:hypothetical protein